MNEPRLVPGLLECARAQLLRFTETNPDHPHAAQIADATDHTAAAIKALTSSIGAGGLKTPDRVTYVPWSDGYAIGYRCLREGEDYYVYLNPSGVTDDGVPNVFLYIGQSGNPVGDEPLIHAVVPQRVAARCGEVTVEHPVHGKLRLQSSEAARLMVAACGASVRDIEVSGLRAAFLAYWQQVEQLLPSEELTGTSQ